MSAPSRKRGLGLRLRGKLTLLSLGVSSIPLAIAGASTARISEASLRSTLREHHLTVSRQGAQAVGAFFGHLIDTLRTDARIFDLTRSSGEGPPTAEATRKFLQFAYHQSDAFSAVGLFDDHGEAIGEPVALANPEDYESFKAHLGVRPEDTEPLRLLMPLGEAMSGGAGVGPVFLGAANRSPHVIVAVAFDPRLGGGKRVLAAMVSLRALADHVRAASSPDTDVRLLDARARLVASGGAGGFGDLAPLAVPGAEDDRLPPTETIGEYTSGGRAVVGAFAPVPGYAFGVVVENSLASALRPVARVRQATLFWMAISALVAALVAGAMARGLSARVEALAGGARDIAQGRLDTRLDVRSSDELAELAASFNAMATSLDAARREIMRQTQEIKSWNESLERRVEEKTQELRQAQEMLLRSRSLAAVGELGAGVAHEINNPLTGVLGLAQLLLMELPHEHPARPMVSDIEQQSLRIRQIVSNLLRLAQRQAGEDRRPVDMRRVLDDALDLVGPSDLAAAHVTVKKAYAETLPPVRASQTQLQEALMHLIKNARGAMDGGGTLTLSASCPEAGVVRVSVRDTGRGIDAQHLPRIFDPFFTTRKDWSRTGMGLSVVHKIVEDHGGSIRVESTVGQGTTFLLTFPADLGGAQLA